MRVLALFLLFPVTTALTAQEAIKLPWPKMSTYTLDQSLVERKSERALSGPALSIDTISKLLWSTQGENRRGTGRRTVPSASARYPLELYVVVADSPGLPEGVYRYDIREHSITKIKDGNPKSFFSAPEIRTAAWVAEAPAVFIISGNKSRMRTYHNDPDSPELYTYWESGAASQALSMQVAALGLGATVLLGANLEEVRKAAGLPEDERVSVFIPVGRIAAR